MKKVITRPGGRLRIVGLLLFLTVAATSRLYAVGTDSHTTTIRVSHADISLGKLIDEVESQTDYLFIYNKDEVNMNAAVKVKPQEGAIEKVLANALASAGIAYELTGDYIALKKTGKESASVQQSDLGKLKGRVIDNQGQALIGVMMLIKDSDKGTVTDVNGNYAVDAKAGQTLIISYVGYKTEEKKVPASLSLDVVLQEDIKALDEVVVVGMGSQRKVSVIGAITSVRMAELKTPARSLVNSLGGRMAGVVAVQRSGEPGYDNAAFWIRGISTFGENKTPLILVDGVERSMDNLDPEEIESVSILKDASATAVYGVRAANGVVLVNTRKGEASIKPSIELKMEAGISQLTRTPQLLDGVNYMKLYNEAAGKDVYSQERIEATAAGTDPYLYPNVNWLNEIFKDKSDNKVISLNIRGGGLI